MICDRCSIVCQFAGEPGECKGVSVSGVQCKKCRYLLKDKDGYNWCPNKTFVDDPDIDLIRNCEWYAVKTNADRIRSMTDEELANCITDDLCDRVCHSPLSCDGNCETQVLAWLKQEYTP